MCETISQKRVVNMPLPTSQTASKRRLLRDEVYTSIYDAIIDGTLAPGELLRDEDLISWLGVSRTPIRQALNRLNDVGLVDMAPGRFTKVSEFDAATVTQATYATGVLHEHSIRAAASSLDPAAQRELQGHLSSATEAAATGNLAVASVCIQNFFDVFHRAAGNQVIAETVSSLSPVLLRFLTPRENMLSLHEILGYLERIATAARDGDAVRAAAITRELFENPRRMFAEKFRASLVAR